MVKILSTLIVSTLLGATQSIQFVVKDGGPCTVIEDNLRLNFAIGDLPINTDSPLLAITTSLGADFSLDKVECTTDSEHDNLRVTHTKVSMTMFSATKHSV